MDEFRSALTKGVNSGRFFKAGDSYMLANKNNEAYDPVHHEQWLDEEEFDGSQREAMRIDYEVQFGLHDYTFK